MLKNRINAVYNMKDMQFKIEIVKEIQRKMCLTSTNYLID